MTKIEWTDATHQLTTGCTKCSPGCANCYAERMHRRLAGMGMPLYQQPFNEVKCWPDQIAAISSLKVPRKHKGPYRVFINSMSDLFHEDVPDGFIGDVFRKVFARRDDSIIFQILTKRADRLARMKWTVGSGPYVHLGVTVCNQAEADAKIPLLLQVPTAVRFVSIEPMLGPVDLEEYLSPIGAETCNYGEAHEKGVCDCRQSVLSWVICGGETGPGARPMHPDWVRSLREQCKTAGVPFFFKGWGEWLGGKFDRRKSKMVCKPAELGEEVGRIFWTNPGAPKVHLWDEADQYWTNGSARVGKKAAGRVLDGRTWEEFPA